MKFVRMALYVAKFIEAPCVTARPAVWSTITKICGRASGVNYAGNVMVVAESIGELTADCQERGERSPGGMMWTSAYCPSSCTAGNPGSPSIGIRIKHGVPSPSQGVNGLTMYRFSLIGAVSGVILHSSTGAGSHTTGTTSSAGVS